MKHQCVFLFIFSVLLLLGVGGQVLQISNTLQGATFQSDYPEVDLHNIMNGQWQEEYEIYLSENIKIREILIPLKNQITYSIFKSSPNSNIVIGKNGELYEEEYIAFETQIFSPMTQESVEELVQKLTLLNNYCINHNKKLFIFITPSKAEIYRENIPNKYLLIAPQEKSASTYSIFVRLLNANNISYYDSIPDVQDLKTSADFRVFPKTGTHWSRVTAMYCAVNLADAMEEQLNINLPEISVSYVQNPEPTHPDADIYQLLNLMKKPKGPFFDPIMEITDSVKDDYSIFVRGGSFMGNSLYCLVDQGFFSNSYFLSNTSAISSNGLYSDSFDSYDQLPLQEMIDDSDIIFLEVNEEAISRMSFGLIDYLLENNLVE